MQRLPKWIKAVYAIAVAIMALVVALGVSAFVHWCESSAGGNVILFIGFLAIFGTIAVQAYREFDDRA